jgi:hypothetical protein
MHLQNMSLFMSYLIVGFKSILVLANMFPLQTCFHSKLTIYACLLFHDYYIHICVLGDKMY